MSSFFDAERSGGESKDRPQTVLRSEGERNSTDENSSPLSFGHSQELINACCGLTYTLRETLAKYPHHEELARALDQAIGISRQPIEGIIGDLKIIEQVLDAYPCWRLAGIGERVSRVYELAQAEMVRQSANCLETGAR